VVVEHARHPVGAGLRAPFDAEVLQVVRTCGDEVRLRVRLDRGPDGDRVGDVSHEALGCTVSVAGTSVATATVTGLPVEQALARCRDAEAVVRGERAATWEEDGDLAAFTTVSGAPGRLGCALLGWAAVRRALAEAARTTSTSTANTTTSTSTTTRSTEQEDA